MVRGIVRESLGVSVEAVCPGIPVTSTFKMARCIRQGGIESPWCFNMVIRTILARDGHRWHMEGVETPILGRGSVLSWADNLVFVARSGSSAQQVIDDFTTPMHRHGMHWKPSWMQFLQVGCFGAVPPTTRRHAYKHRHRGDLEG